MTAKKLRPFKANIANFASKNQVAEALNDEYQTIAAPSEGKITEKMSKFLAFAFPVTDALQARERIAEVGRRYHDARHVCWAYKVGHETSESLSNDNGEPSGTAGKPILGQINSFELTDVVVAVVRYFGGIKLGTSGLIAAYRAAAREALSNAKIVKRHVMATVGFTFPYLAMNAVMRVAKQPGVKIASQQFDNACAMTLEVRKDDAVKLRRQLDGIDGVIVD